jgi:hypothetical protein
MSFFSRLFGSSGSKQPEKELPDDPIDAFWTWWQDASVELARAYDRGEGPSDELIEIISERVNAMDEGLAWETGPGTTSDHHFALSPEGDAELRVLTQRWLSRAPPPSKSWEYYPARQAGGADPRCQLCIEGREFEYGDFRVAAERDDTRAVVNVVVYHPHYENMGEEERLQPTFLFLDGLLGEDDVASWVGTIDAADEEPSSADSASALAEMVRALREDWNDETVSLLEGKHNDAPLIAAMRLGLKRLHHLLHDHHLELILMLTEPSDTGLPSGEELEELEELEGGLVEALGHRAIWIGHETYEGKRVIHFHGDSSAALQDEVTEYCRVHGHWEAELSVTHDPSWSILKRY